MDRVKVRMDARDSYCNNYKFLGTASPTASLSRNGADPKKCALRVLENEECGRRWFDYSPKDGSCYCAKKGDRCKERNGDRWQPQGGRAQWNIYEIEHVLKRGDRVRVVSSFKADGKARTPLENGIEGVIDKIDIDGQALINFDHVDVRQWVKPKNFDKLEIA